MEDGLNVCACVRLYVCVNVSMLCPERGEMSETAITHTHDQVFGAYNWLYETLNVNVQCGSGRCTIPVELGSADSGIGRQNVARQWHGNIVGFASVELAVL